MCILGEICMYMTLGIIILPYIIFGIALMYYAIKSIYDYKKHITS